MAYFSENGIEICPKRRKNDIPYKKKSKNACEIKILITFVYSKLCLEKSFARIWDKKE